MIEGKAASAPSALRGFQATSNEADPTRQLSANLCSKIGKHAERCLALDNRMPPSYRPVIGNFDLNRPKAAVMPRTAEKRFRRIDYLRPRSCFRISAFVTSGSLFSSKTKSKLRFVTPVVWLHARIKLSSTPKI